jgi:RNA polymerase sigma factor (sigma-70 family)
MTAAETDANLLAASLKRPERFEAIFDMHAPAIYRYLRRRIGDHLAEELTAETFACAFRARRQFDSRQESALPWLYGIAVNLIRMHVRSEQRRKSAYRLFAQHAPIEPSSTVESDSRLDARALGPALNSALTALSPDQREVLLLNAWAGLSPGEIAQALSISHATARKCLHRARVKAVQQLEHYDPKALDTVPRTRTAQMTQLDDLLRQHSQQIPLDDLPERDALDHARKALQTVVVSDPTRVPRRRSPRRAARVALIAGLAATIAVVVALLPGGTRNDAAPLGPATASAQSVLQLAARAISSHAWRPLRSGQYFYYRDVGSYPGHNAPASDHPTEIQNVWVGSNGFARIVQTGPDTVIAGGDVLIFHATPQQLRAERERQRHGAHLHILAYPQKYRWLNLDYQQLIQLPTDPSVLEQYIERTATGGGPRFAHIFSSVEGYLTGAALPPKVSAAMYHVVARLPGMRLIGPTHDQLGRPGVAVGLFFRNQPGRAELIFNPTTGVLLAERSIALNPKTIHAPVGSVVDWSAITRQGVVNSHH